MHAATRIGLAALAYWAMIFALGFVLGTIRFLWLVPWLMERGLGGTVAVALELPVMLGASWLVARWLLRRFAIAGAGAALAMGLVAFAILMVSEVVLAITMAGTPPAEWLAGFARRPAQLGLAGQVVFALIPWLVARRSG